MDWCNALRLLHPTWLARLNPADAQRIQRALEVCILTGQMMSSLLEEDAAADLPYNVHVLALSPSDRWGLVQYRPVAKLFRGGVFLV